MEDVVRELHPIEEGYFRKDKRLSPGGQQRYRVLIDTERQRLLAAYDLSEEERPSMKDIKAEAEAIVVQEAFEESKAPFGRQKGVYYRCNTVTGEVEVSGSVFICQTPTDFIRPGDLMAQAKSRFNTGGRKLSFTSKTKPTTVAELQRVINRQTFVQGVSSDGDKAVEYAKERGDLKRETEGARLRAEADGSKEVKDKRKKRAHARELKEARRGGSKRAVAALDKALEQKE